VLALFPCANYKLTLQLYDYPSFSPPALFSILGVYMVGSNKRSVELNIGRVSPVNVFTTIIIRLFIATFGFFIFFTQGFPIT
jgi:hypothetical protein